ncbi:MAG: hypothetical protein WB676_28155 [Bryobacteraceae bacterium]
MPSKRAGGGLQPAADFSPPQLSSNPERGSALLIVLVFAAIVAIMLYKALPDAYFEAQRQKEQLLIDRANEYKTAIKRFVTKNQTYPTSLDQLDNLNGVRYLRHHYKDPMTGKTEWRLIHVMNPGFILTDSKVTPMNSNGTTGQNGAAAPNGTNQGGFGSNSSAFGTSNSTSSSSSFGNNSAFGQSSSSSFNQNEADSNTPPGPSAAQLYGARRRPPAIPSTSMEGQQSDDNSGQPDADKPLPEPGTPDTQQAQNGAPDPGGTPPAGNGAAQQGDAASGPPGSDPNNPAASALNSVNSALRQQQPKPSTFASSSSSSGPTISNGSIAGVASTAKGNSIKVINKQTDYSKWEFVYNPQQDAANQLQKAIGNNNANGQNPNGQNQNNTSGFGSNSSTNTGGFGSTSGSGFGSSNTSNSTNTNSSTNSSSFGNH